MKALQTNIKLFLYTPNKFFEIPNFQRPYSWTADNVQMFLDDLEEVKRGDKKHYFGSIVYINDGDRSIIIDGQQRATTVLLMITAIYHLALESPEKIELVAEQIKDEYLYNRYAKQYGSEENRIKLRAVTTDNKIFEKIFSQAELTEYEKKSNLYKSYLQFYEYFRDRDHLDKELHLTIEHIMPQTMTNAWRDELGDRADEIHGTYLHGLANLTLTGYNSEYSNKSFREKRDMPDGFADSPLKINKTVAKYDTWNEAAILERQRWWIDKIIKIWPLPTSTFEPPILDTKVNIFDDIDFTGAAVKIFYIGDDSYPVTSWSQILGVYCEYLYDENSDFTDQIMNSEKTKNWISNDSKRFFNSVKIHDTGLVVNVATNTNQKIRLMRELAEMFNVDKISINIELTKPIEQ